MYNTFEKLNERFGCDTPGSQLYFSRIEVIETKYESGHPLWRVFGYTYQDSYIDCAWLDLPSQYSGLVPGIYERPDECQHSWRPVTNGEYFVLYHVCDKCGVRQTQPIPAEQTRIENELSEWGHPSRQ